MRNEQDSAGTAVRLRRKRLNTYIHIVCDDHNQGIVSRKHKHKSFSYGRKSTSVMVRRCNSSHRRNWRGDQRTRRDILSCGSRLQNISYIVIYIFNKLYDDIHIYACACLFYTCFLRRREGAEWAYYKTELAKKNCNILGSMRNFRFREVLLSVHRSIIYIGIILFIYFKHTIWNIKNNCFFS